MRKTRSSNDPREDFGYSRTVSYINSSHFSVVTQRWGSVNGKVMPFCAANVLLSIALVWLQQHGIDLSISEFGHEFMSILVAFLVINKLSFTLSLYYELQGYLSKMNQSSIELAQLACAFTCEQDGKDYKEWRFQVTLQTLSLLKAVVCVFYKGGEEEVWEAPDFRNMNMELVVDERKDNSGLTSSTTSLHKELYVWGFQLKSDKNLRVPIRIAQRLRNQIMKHKSLPGDPIDTIQERTLLDCVQRFMNSYHGVRKYATCPLPLPLVQLGRIFVIFYIFTLSFALLSNELNLQYAQMMILTCLMTYGFMGMELLYVEIDDPFAEDPNDLPLTEESRAAGEDICLSLMFQDGREAVDKVKELLDLDRFNAIPYISNGKTEFRNESDPLLSNAV